MGELIASLRLSEIFLVVIGLLTPPLIVFGVKNRSDQIISSQSEVLEALVKLIKETLNFKCPLVGCITKVAGWGIGIIQNLVNGIARQRNKEIRTL